MISVLVIVNIKLTGTNYLRNYIAAYKNYVLIHNIIIGTYIHFRDFAKANNKNNRTLNMNRVRIRVQKAFTWD